MSDHQAIKTIKNAPAALPWLLLANSGVVVLIFMGAVINRLPNPLIAWYSCPFRELTGYPCPTCGGTHVFMALAELRLKAAFLSNPLIFLGAWAPGLGLAIVLGEFLSGGKRVSDWAGKLAGQSWLKWLVLGIVLINWVYLVLADRLF